MKNSTKSLKTLKLFLAMVFVILSGTAINAQTVWSIIQASPDHDTLEAAIEAAELDATLSGDGPFTVFAPTDDAFDALPAGVLDDLLADPSGDLTDILLYHVVAATAMASDISNGDVFETVLGNNIVISVDGNGNVFVNNAQVTVTDLEADNGVVHVIDAVLLPRTTVADIIIGSEAHTTLAAAVAAANLTVTLSNDGPFTVFAPTDDAFDALPAGVVNSLLEDPTGELANILLYHVVGSTAFSGDLTDGQEIETLLGLDIQVTFSSNGETEVSINGAKVTVADIEADNGVVHVIDAVLLPPYELTTAESDDFGTIFTDSDGNTLYFFTRDADGTSACAGTCIENWPVFYTENAVFPASLNADYFGEIDRGAGVMQTTYKGWPLYYFINDNEVGDINGDGVNNIWFVAKPDYTIMLTNNQLTGADGVNYTADYEPGDEVIQYLVNAAGLTLYTWINDFKNRNMFTAEDFANNNIWPIYDETEFVLPSTLDAADFAVIDVHGTSQMTYRGWPLYFFVQDNERGENKGVSVPAPGVWPVAVPDMDEATDYTVVSIITGSPDHTTLATAVAAAGLVDALSAEGPFTVFAPTNDAFDALPTGLLDALLEDPTGDLTDILLYHVVAAQALSTDLSDGDTFTTLLGKNIAVTINAEGEVFINDAQVIVADLMADNGVVHVIDAVLTPPVITVVDIILGSEAHTTLAAALTAAGLVDALNAEGPFTVFAPTDDAFDALPDGLVAALLEDPEGDLTDILMYHVVAAQALSTDLEDGDTFTTLLGKDITITINAEGEVFVNDAQVVVANLTADNGVVHVIDAVLVPETSTNVQDIAASSTMLSIYPNPARNQLNLRMDLSGASSIKVNIYNITGSSVFSKELGSRSDIINETFDISHLNQGTYIITLRTDNEVISRKINLIR